MRVEVNGLVSSNKNFLKSILRWPWELIALLIFLGWLYAQTLPPGISSWIIKGWDSAMLQIVGSTWGIPHSPGYPLYTILANLFVRLLNVVPGLWNTAVVWRVTFWSTTTSLLTLLFLYLIVRRLSQNRIAAMLAAGILGVSFIFWRGAIMAEVYSFNALIFALTFWLALRWDAERRDRWLVALGLALSAGTVHHRTAFILPPTIALWVMLKSPAAPETSKKYWPTVLRRWLILGGVALLPLLSYLYLPLAAQQRAGQTWLYADTSDWNTFWFVVLAREWWGLVETPATPAEWFAASKILFRQQVEQITLVGLLSGVIGLMATRRYLWLFSPPFLALTLFGMSYRVADVDSMLIPLTLILCIGTGVFFDLIIQSITQGLTRLLKADPPPQLIPALQGTITLLLIVGIFFLFRPVAEANYQTVDLSSDWQAVDLVEEVVAIAGAGTPLTIIGQDNSVLPDFIYAQVVLGQPVEALSTTTLNRMPPEESRALLESRLAQGRRVLVDSETLSPELGFLPWLKDAIRNGEYFRAPTGHPFLWELLPRPMDDSLPQNEVWQPLPPGQFLDGQLSVTATHQAILPKRGGCFLRLTLFWQADSSLPDDYYIAVQPQPVGVVDQNDHLALMRGYLPTSQLQPDEIVRDEIDLLIRQPKLLPQTTLTVILYQVQGDQFPTFGEIALPVTVDPGACEAEGVMREK